MDYVSCIAGAFGVVGQKVILCHIAAQKDVCFKEVTA